MSDVMARHTAAGRIARQTAISLAAAERLLIAVGDEEELALDIVKRLQPTGVGAEEMLSIARHLSAVGQSRVAFKSVADSVAAGVGVSVAAIEIDDRRVTVSLSCSSLGELDAFHSAILRWVPLGFALVSVMAPDGIDQVERLGRELARLEEYGR